MMLSRVANSIYWMSRYLERAENVARFIDVNTHLMLDLGLSFEDTQWYPLIATSGDDDGFKKRYTTPDEKSVVRFLTFDDKNPNSILSSIYRARENARTVREVIPVEVWEKINELYHLTQSHSRKRSVEALQDYYTEVRQSGTHFAGMMINAMSRGDGWHFARMGQLLERADKTARLLDVKYFLLLPRGEQVDSPYDNVQWGAVLKSVNALEMYRQEYHSINYRDVTQFLLFSKLFPRSVRFSLDYATVCMEAICETQPRCTALEEMKSLHTRLMEADATTIIASGLHEFIDDLQQGLNRLDQTVYETFFKD
ncbi:alpha-E domain-containing protein [Asticcacaulis sp. AND118]|uniref:alpha-E domain-containing protein n=1 Tax=Asticcacaulis sp. AND118 TaxID=2840468 RepID=UPI001CFFD6A5|nr:alpha-E domain-containing protein [Asticcacaulis sp. AND118]UDF03079.1 alpha-E domain-containing protein [Asticcacaulis sp. AND118]